jgi:hypothetical protein
MPKLTLKDLTAMELKVATLTVENEFADKGEQRTVQAIADELGVSRQAYYAHRNKPQVIKYMDLLTDRYLDVYKARVGGQLMKLVNGGNNGTPSTKAIELYLKWRGQLIDRTATVEDEDNLPSRITQAEIDAELKKLEDLL